MSIVKEGIPIKKLIRQQMKKHGYIFKTLGEKLGITESAASKTCKKDYFDTFRLFIAELTVPTLLAAFIPANILSNK